MCLCLVLCIFTGILRTAEQARTELLNKTFVSFHKIEWEQNNGCRELSSDAHSFKQLLRTVTWGTDLQSTTTCLSKTLFPQHSYLELEFAGYSKATEASETYISLETSLGKEIKRIHPSEDQNSGVWKLSTVILEDINLKNGLRIRIFDKANTDGWIALRNRVNEYKTNLSMYKFRRFFRDTLPGQTFKISSAICLSLLLLCLLNVTRTQQVAFIYLLPIAWHLNTRTYFFGDDFMYFEQFNKGWLHSIFYRHNEHVLPVFSSFFKIQFSVFGDWYRPYSLVSLLLLSVVTHTLYCVFEDLTKLFKLNVLLAPLLSLLFLLSGLHSETVQWLTCQSTLLSLLFRLFCYYFILRYLRQEEKRHLFYAAISALLCPLSFAGGFTLPIEVALLLYALPLHEGKRNKTVLLLGVGIIGLAVALAAVPYILLMDTPGTGLRVAQASAPSATTAFRYVAFGGYFGTVVRGTGLIPIVSISDGYKFFPTISSIFGSFDYFGSALGIAITLAVYLILAKRLKAKGLNRLFFFSQMLIILPFLISCIGRTRFGVDYSLQLRFHSVSLLGLCLAILCISSCISRPNKFSKIKYLLGFLALASHLYSQQIIVDSMTFFTSRGPRTRSFVEQIKHWNSVIPISTNTQSEHPLEIGISSPFLGLYPVYYGGNPSSPSARISTPSRKQISQLFKY
jgi:hypothetical protein